MTRSVRVTDLPKDEESARARKRRSTMLRAGAILVAIGMGLSLALAAQAATTNTIQVFPKDVPDENWPRVNPGDAPAGFDPSSWQGPAAGKSNWYAAYGDKLDALFPADAATLKIADLAAISYFTKRPAATPPGRDWWIIIYTRPTGSGDAATWYHDRFINNYSDHADTDAWTQYSTASGMTFHSNALGGPVMSLADLITAHGSDLIGAISIQTDSGWNGFDGYVDGLEITLNNGNVGQVNFETDSATVEIAPCDVPDEQPPRANTGDAPLGFGPDSWQGPASGKSNYHVRYLADGDKLSALFPTEAATLTINDLHSISYFTKRPASTPAGRDWWVQIYTRPTGSGDAASWYHAKFTNNYSDHTETDAWTQYSTDGSMTFGGQTLAQLQAAVGTQEIEMISIQTDSGWNGFDGYVDGLVITLNDGKVGRVDLVTSSGDRYVDATGTDGSNSCLNLGSPCATIQHAVDASCPGSTINVAAGTYVDPVNVEGHTGLTIRGADKTTVIVQPTSTVCLGLAYGCSRVGVFRVVDSTDVVLQNMTMDFSVIKADGANGIFYWDSTGTVDNNIIENMSVVDTSSGGYSEIGSYFRAPDYTDTSRAAVAITNNTYIDAGRVGVLTHGFVDATISGNTFYKTFPDFGYAMEIGSESTGTIGGNTIHGYNTPAASDGSESAGIYIENDFTGTCFGSPDSNLAKPVTVENNDIYDCQYGLWIGNGYDCYAGDVHIDVALNNNNLHDNTNGAAWIQDEDKADGSSVTVNGGGNSVVNNGTYGYYIYTNGDGDVTVDLSQEWISGNGTGVSVYDAAAASGSSYNVALACSRISGNDTGVASNVSSVSNTVTVSDSSIAGNTLGADGSAIPSGSLTAQGNFWGCAAGPPGAGCDAVTANVDASSPLSVEPLCITCVGAGGDVDGDQICGNFDNCPAAANVDQTDTDGDGLGDACDACPNDANNDTDDDGVCGDVDNCPTVANPDQSDVDGDGAGDLCSANFAAAGLILRRTVLKVDTSTRQDNGSIVVQGSLNVNPPYNGVPDAIIAGGVTVEVTGAGGVNETIDLTTANGTACNPHTTRYGPRIKCLLKDGTKTVAALIMRPHYHRVPNLYDVTIRALRRSFTGSLTIAPVGVTLFSLYDYKDNIGETGDCKVKGSRSICREQGIIP